MNTPVNDVTQTEAQEIHDLACDTDPDHDAGAKGGCWCCCTSCEFDFDAVMANGM